MKKMMFAAVAALAMVGVANAAKSYGISAGGSVSPYSLDTAPCDEHVGWYSSYVMKQEDAQKAMGTTETVTYSDMATWLGKNFADNQASVIDNAEKLTEKMWIAEYDVYYFSNGSFGSGSGLGDAIAVLFYDDNENLAYNVMANMGEEFFGFSRDYSAASGWQAVPEPTSGMLLLLGVAGLALKRKRA